MHGKNGWIFWCDNVSPRWHGSIEQRISLQEPSAPSRSRDIDTLPVKRYRCLRNLGLASKASRENQLFQNSMLIPTSRRHSFVRECISVSAVVVIVVVD